MKTETEIIEKIGVYVSPGSGEDKVKMEGVAFGIYAEMEAPHCLSESEQGIALIRESLARAIFLKLNPRT